MTLAEYLAEKLTPPPNQAFAVRSVELAANLARSIQADGYRVVKLREPFAAAPDLYRVEEELT